MWNTHETEKHELDFLQGIEKEHMMTNPKHNTQATKYVNNYLAIDNPRFAVLIKGNWGSGKSWFIKKTLMDYFEGDEAKYLYVSLYECASKSDIEDEFFQQLHPLLSSRPVTIGTKWFKTALKAAFRVDLDNDGKPDTTLTTNLPNMTTEELNEFSRKKHSVIVFDDFERSSMEIQALMGYINSFVEHLGYNVIIICNEKEIDEPKLELYKKAKEKLVGKTLKITPESEQALNYFIDSSSDDEEYKKRLRRRKKLILSIFDASNKMNLRQLEKCLQDFKWLYDELSSQEKSKVYLFDDLLSGYLVFAIETMGPKFSPIDIQSIEKLWIDHAAQIVDGEDNSQNIYSAISKRYPFFNVMKTPLEFKTWAEILEKGIPERETIIESLKNTGYFKRRNNPTWEKLWDRYEIDDDSFDTLIVKLLDELDRFKYTDIGEFIHITGLLSNFENKKILPLDEKDVTKLLYSYVDWMIENKHIEPDLRGYDVYPRDAAFSLGFSGTDTPIFKSVINYLDNELIKAKKTLINNSVEGLFEMFVSDLQQFYNLTTDDGQDCFFARIPIFTKFSTTDFAHILALHLENGNYMLVHSLFSRRYRYFIPELQSERNWLKELESELKSLSDSRAGRLSGAKIEDFINASAFKEAIENMKPPVKKP